MTLFKITSQQMDLGEYEGETAQQALEAMARVAGYSSHEEACKTTGADPSDWTKSRREWSQGKPALLVEKV